MSLRCLAKTPAERARGQVLWCRPAPHAACGCPRSARGATQPRMHEANIRFDTRRPRLAARRRCCACAAAQRVILTYKQPGEPSPGSRPRPEAWKSEARRLRPGPAHCSSAGLRLVDPLRKIPRGLPPGRAGDQSRRAALRELPGVRRLRTCSGTAPGRPANSAWIGRSAFRRAM